MNSDRELLEAAAKAYWGDEIDDVCSIEWDDDDQCIAYTHADNQDHNGHDVQMLWNPLTDDGDALRLAVRLNFSASRSSGIRVGCWAEKAPFDTDLPGHDTWTEVAECWFGESSIKPIGRYETTQLAAVRRAIVIAAAGRSS